MVNLRNKRTKIVATISDQNCEVAFIKKLYENGLDVVRLNTAHQGTAESLKVIENIRAVSDRIPILVDTKGPEVRICGIETPFAVKRGEIVRFKGGTAESKSGSGLIHVSYPKFSTDVPVGSIILYDNGEITFTVKEKESDAVVCVVENDGTVKNKKSINVPNVHLNQETLSKKDKEFIKFAIEQNVDFIAHSFVRNKNDVLTVQKLLDEAKSEIKIIAKIENREGVDNIDEILDHAYGIMVARGDLGAEIPLPEVPMVQKQIIKKCIKRAKPVIVATHMLESMITNPRPTRAEVSDVANAILDGTSALMLSGETAYGKYPSEAVKIMSSIAITLEQKKSDFKYSAMETKSDDIPTILAKAAIAAAVELNASALIVPSVTGTTARILSAFRAKLPIYAQCFNPKVMRELALSYGVHVRFLEACKTTDELVGNGLKKLVDHNDLKMDDVVVVLARTPGHSPDSTNFMEINTVKNCIENYRE